MPAITRLRFVVDGWSKRWFLGVSLTGQRLPDVMHDRRTQCTSHDACNAMRHQPADQDATS